MRLLKFLAGLALLPLCVAVTLTLGTLLQRWLPEARIAPAWYGFGVGVSLWLFLFFARPAPDREYVLGHELTHAFWGLLLGARIGRMNVSKTGGFVELSKSNAWITLAPYCFPFYTWVVFAALGGTSLFFDPHRLLPAWLALIGFTWAFHVTLTLKYLLIHQPDIREHGRIFSYAVIYLANIAGLCLGIVAGASPTFREWGALTVRDATTAYQGAGRAAVQAARWTTRQTERLRVKNSNGGDAPAPARPSDQNGSR